MLRLKIFALLFTIALLLMAMLPGIITSTYDRRSINSIKSERNNYTSPQTCWLLTKTGIIISFFSLFLIVIGLFYLKYFLQDWFDMRVANKTKEITFCLLISFILILFSLTISGSYIVHFRKHKNDFIHFGNENIEISYEGKKDVVTLSQIDKIDIKKKEYAIYQKDGYKTTIPKDMVNSLIGSDQLKHKLENLATEVGSLKSQVRPDG